MLRIDKNLFNRFSELLVHIDVRTTMIYTHTVKSCSLKESTNPLEF
jgi:site-specific recombinase XerD